MRFRGRGAVSIPDKVEKSMLHFVPFFLVGKFLFSSSILLIYSFFVCAFPLLRWRLSSWRYCCAFWDLELGRRGRGLVSISCDK